MNTKLMTFGVMVMIVGGLAPNIYGVFVGRSYLFVGFAFIGLGWMLAVASPIWEGLKIIYHWND